MSMAVSKGREGISLGNLVNKGTKLLSHQSSEAFAYVFNTDNSPMSPAKNKTNITSTLPKSDENTEPNTPNCEKLSHGSNSRG